MCPFLHDRIVPEIVSSGLPRKEFRILIDPRCVREKAIRHLVDFDILKQYLVSLPGVPCQITLHSPAPGPEVEPGVYELLERYGVEVLRFGRLVVPDVVDAFGPQADAFPKEVALLSTAAASDIDMVTTDTVLPGKDNLVRKVGIYIDNWEGAKKQSAVFARGHEVPWSFSVPMWGCPWTPFYAMTEPFTPLIQLRELSCKVGIDAHAQELLRSLALNRHSNLCYTRDKLLFYVQQQRASARANLEKQDFGFELGYYLNHYYLLFWAGLDQLCWIVNSVFGLGYSKADWRKVGALNQAFITRMREVAPQVATAFADSDFLRWAKMLRSARHFVAHEGLAMPSVLVLTTGKEPSEEELDREIERSNEWRELEKSIGRNLLEEFRPTFRFKAKLRRYKQCPERILRLQIDGETCLIYPLLNVEWDFANYYKFAERIGRLAIDHLKKGMTP